MIQESVVPKKDSEDIFKNIPQLTSISDILAMELSDAVRNFDRDPFAVGSVFLHHVRSLGRGVRCGFDAHDSTVGRGMEHIHQIRPELCNGQARNSTVGELGYVQGIPG